MTSKIKVDNISKVSDLKSKNIIAFQNATKYLGNEFATMAKLNDKYREEAKQITQNKLLYKSRTDVVVGDQNIFKYFTKQIKDEIDTNQEVQYHNLFPKTEYTLGCHSKKIIDDFNVGLATIKKNGTYEKIVSKYTN